MARVRYLGNEPATVPELGGRAVHPDEVVEVPDERFGGYVMQTSLWESVDEPPGWEPPAVAEPHQEPQDETPARTSRATKKTAAEPQKEG